MKQFLLIILLTVMPNLVMAEQTPVRGFVWGLPKEIVKSHEMGTFVGDESTVVDGKAQDILFFRDKIRGLFTTIGYEFTDNKLWRVRIFIENKYVEQQDMIKDLLTIHTDLNKRFGAPKTEEMQWIDKRNLNYPESWGWSVFRGELIMTSQWQDGETDVRTYLGAKTKYKPTMNVTYTHRPTKMLMEQKDEINTLNLPQ